MRQMITKLVCAVATVATLAPGWAAADAVADWEADPTVTIAAADVALDAFTWIARPVVVFADSPRDPRLAQQLDELAEHPEDLAERDVVVIIDADPAAQSALRTALRPRGFMVAILAKDGTVAARKPTPRSLREITRQIDSMPLRRQEMRDRRGGR